MNYCQFQPPAYLREYVHYFWSMESPAATLTPQSFGPLVDGCPGFIFQRTDEGRFVDEYGKSMPDFFAYGQTIKRMALFMVGRFKTVGVCLRPHALPALVGCSARELTDNCLDIRLMSIAFVEQLIHTASVAGQIDLISGFLWNQIRQLAKPVDKLTTYALTQLMESKGNASLKELHQSLQTTERSLERKFDQHVGISPKLFARVCRFQASLTQLKHGNLTKLSDIAFENGYADQSHFIRSFREFTGFAPTQYQQQPYDVVNNFPSIIP